MHSRSGTSHLTTWLWEGSVEWFSKKHWFFERPYVSRSAPSSNKWSIQRNLSETLLVRYRLWVRDLLFAAPTQEKPGAGHKGLGIPAGRSTSRLPLLLLSPFPHLGSESDWGDLVSFVLPRIDESWTRLKNECWPALILSSCAWKLGMESVQGLALKGTTRWPEEVYSIYNWFGKLNRSHAR